MTNTHPFKNWPSLAPFGKTLSLPEGNLFYYDSVGSADSEGNADSGEGIAGKPALILIHGLGDEADTWRHIFPVLANAGHRVIAPDLPGFGRSVRKSGINVRTQSEAIIRLINETGAANPENPAMLAGSSLGAGIAELVAGKRPELVKGLILLGGCFPFSGISGAALYLLGLPFLGKSWYRGFRSNHEGAWKSLYPYYGDLNAMGDADKTFLRERVIDRVESPDQERGYFATLRSINAFFLFSKRSGARKIKAFRGNIALIWGERDNIFALEKTVPFRRLRPDADFSLIPGAGHLPHQEQPEETAAKMLQFLKEK